MDQEVSGLSYILSLSAFVSWVIGTASFKSYFFSNKTLHLRFSYLKLSSWQVNGLGAISTFRYAMSFFSLELVTQLFLLSLFIPSSYSTVVSHHECLLHVFVFLNCSKLFLMKSVDLNKIL